MPPMEIERKFTVKALPENLDSYPFHLIEQAYLNTDPVLRIRRQDDEYYLTYKGKGLMAREEYNLPLNQSSYEHLLPKADGICISKKRYLIPWDPYTIELDVFEKSLAAYHRRSGISIRRGSECIHATRLVRPGCDEGSGVS